MARSEVPRFALGTLLHIKILKKILLGRPGENFSLSSIYKDFNSQDQNLVKNLRLNLSLYLHSSLERTEQPCEKYILQMRRTFSQPAV